MNYLAGLQCISLVYLETDKPDVVAHLDNSLYKKI